ncbi:MBL fold metallo-hydrolase [Ferrovum sp. PN-J185]|uniref:MBL fold metallo-hydrolase n=1 Tax=Ferrovum sp. PN-J185 TaxID=1356306 RepID=UPI00079759A3|nr:MBL fold metallo-hydrolase [Ferrovum sp. PN-J185]KXW55373.1 putative metallo-hydrolase [Ferrovum sp. PN-J185]
MMKNHVIHPFFDKETWTFSYVVYSPNDAHALVIDSVLNFDQKSGRFHTHSADEIIHFVKQNNLIVDYILETHAHADHISAGYYLKQALGGQLVIGKTITGVQSVFKDIFNLGNEFIPNGSDFDILLNDKDCIQFGESICEAITVPGHTPACLAYRIENCLFVGDTLFMPDVGTARCDFPGGDASSLYWSIQKLYSYPDDTLVYLCHDYPPQDRQHISYQTTIKEQKEKNIHVHTGVTEEQFVELRSNRDKTLTLPNLIIPSIQINIRAGKYPTPESNGVSYLKTPINYFI